MSFSASFDAASCPLPVGYHDCIVLGHGSGGRLSAQLVEGMLLPAFRNPALEQLDDQAILPMDALGDGRLAFTTDSFVVSPIFFPGGDIGQLAVNGTVNDLAVGGARPLALSLAFILEEGFPLAELQRVVDSVRAAAERSEVPIVTGDTKVVGRGHGDGIFINTSGVGVVPRGLSLGSAQVRAGDAILVSGSIGDHGLAVLSQRQGIRLGGELKSDTAPLYGLCRTLIDACPGLHAMRDPTRGGVASALSEITMRRGLGCEIEESAIVLDEAVRGACELLGLDPLLVANEGKLLAFVAEEQAERALSAMRAHPLGAQAARIGSVTADNPGTILIHTPFGGTRVLDLPLTEPLPRIC